MIQPRHEKFYAWLKSQSFFSVAAWFVCIAAGFIARWYIILHAGSWWFDESASYSFAKVPILQSWHYLKYENSPPLYYWLLKGWGLVFGFGEFQLRSFSLIVGFFVMIAIMRLAAELFDWPAAMWAGCIYAMTSLAIFADTEARMYSLLSLFIVLSWFYFVKIIKTEAGRSEIVWCILFSMCAMYVNVTALWIPVTQIVVLFFLKPKSISRRAAMIAVGAPVILFLPWLGAFAMQRLAFSKYITTGSWRYFANGPAWATMLLEPALFFNFWSTSNSGIFLISLVGFFTALIWWLHHWYAKKERDNVGAFIVTSGLLVPLILSAVTVNLGSPVYYYQSAIFLWIMMGYGVAYGISHIQEKFFLGVLIFSIGCYAIFNIQLATLAAVHGNWNIGTQWIDAQHPDIVLAMPKMWDAEVYGPRSKFYFLPPPVPGLQEGDPFEEVIRYNYNWGSLAFELTPTEENYLRTEINADAQGSSRIIFGYQGSQAELAIISDLESLGFRETAVFDVDGYLPEKIGLFERTIAMAPAN